MLVTADWQFNLCYSPGMHACMLHHAHMIVLLHLGAGIKNVESLRKSAQQPNSKPSKGAAAAADPATAPIHATDAALAASVATMHRFLRKVHLHYL